jgi:pimeloyl-ACP methyl ester carboxylesterase
VVEPAGTARRPDGERRVRDGIWVDEAGEGPLVVLVHGALDRSSGMLRVRRALRGPVRVVRYDRRGYARSLPTGPPASFDDQVDDLLAVLDGRRAVLAGHSFGGLVCLAAAERHPELVAAVLAYEAPMPWEPWWPSHGAGSRALADADAADPATPVDAERAAEAAERFLRRMIGDAAWERLPAAVRAERRAEGPTLVAELRSVRPPAPRPYDPARVTVPVVAAHGSRTAAHHVRAAEALARAAPRAELAIIEGAGHGAHLTHPEAFAGLVQRAMELAREGAGEGG